MSKKNKNNTNSKLIPELRFPEFKDAPEWEMKELGDVMDYEQPSPYLIESTAYSVSGTPVLTANKSFILGYTEETTGIYDNIPAIIFDDFTTDSKFVNFPFKIKSSAIKILKAKKNNNLSFLFYTLSKISYQAREHQRHYISQFQPMNIPLPSLAEQERIGEFFSVLDSLIQAQSKEVQLLRLRKKGLMQKMFPYEGETTPEWRFPEFKDAPEWEVKELGEVMTESKILSTVNTNNKLTIKLHLNGICKREGVSKPSNTVYYIRRRGQFIYGKQNLFNGAFGVIPDEYDYFESSTDLPAFDMNAEYSAYYLYYYLSQEQVYKKFENIATGTGSKRVHPKDLFKTIIPLPSLAEQERIGALFSTLDSLIQAQSKEVQLLRLRKKGLMQKMFP